MKSYEVASVIEKHQGCGRGARPRRRPPDTTAAEAGVAVRSGG